MEKGEFQRPLLIVREGGDDLPDAIQSDAVFPLRYQLLAGRQGEVINWLVPSISAGHVDCTISRDNSEPSRKASTCPDEPSWTTPDLQKDLLQDIFGRVGIARDA